MSRRHAWALVVAASALPRVAVLLHERGGILANMEKSDALARVFLDSGTFGYVPGEPSANTQPLYGWFLVAVYWILDRRWWSVGFVQAAVAVATALLVYEIGRRRLSARAGLLAALAATLQPYLVWHDVHGNREILDQLLAAGMFALALGARSAAGGAALGAVSGLAILSNSRLALLPLVLAAYLAWRGAGAAAALAVPALAAVVLAPWVVRNDVQVGCLAITTDARALWKANNLGTYDTLRGGGWIDDVPDIPQRRPHPRPGPWYTPQEAGVYYANTGRKVRLDECAQEAHYEHLVWRFWREHPGAKAKLAAQATWMLWSPRVEREGGPSAGVDPARRIVEPIWAIGVYVLAAAGLAAVPSSLRVLGLAFLAYETLAAWVFAGTTRYRVPFDFVLALLAAAAVDRALAGRPPFRRPRSQKR
ncbi:MAG TPA: glycosyltransferase family 39 protein [Gaiellaceae bacterium]|nr:glycosyltransferase family 39 protein [Gaiellaceae bacterium]